jgi:hypothetical protein
VDRSHEETSVPETAAPAQVAPMAVPAAAPMSLGRPGPSALSTGQVLALQRSVGNGAVSAMLAGGRPGMPARSLARVGEPHTEPGVSKATPKGLVAADFSVSGGAPSAPAKASASTMKREKDSVTFDSAKVTASATVTWGSAAAAPGAAPATPAPAPAPDPAKPMDASVGFINTILASERTLTYTDNGKPDGKVVAMLRSATPKGTRDAWWSKKDGGGQQENTNTFKPFYSKPETLKPGESKTISFEDQPGDSAPLTMKSMDGKTTGKLARMSGADSFRLSVGVTELGGADKPIHLAASEWTVPWDLDVPQVEGDTTTGRDVDIAKYKGALEDIKPGEGFGVGDAKTIPYPVTDEDVATMGLQQLLVAIPFARDWGDMAMWGKMSARMRDLKPRFQVTMDVKQQSGFSMDMTVGIDQAPRTPKPRKINEWGTGDQMVEFSLGEVMDPQDLAQRMTIAVTFTRDGGAAQSAPWSWPFASMSRIFIWDAKDVAKGEVSPEERKKKGKPDVGTEIVVSGRLVT